MKVTILVLATGSFILGGCAQTPPAASDGTIVDTNPEGIICEKVPDIGSRLGKRVCTTRAEREAMAEESRELSRSLQREAQSGSTAPAAPGN